MKNLHIWMEEQARPRRMILVDDSYDDCLLIRKFSASFHCDWTVAPSVEEAWTSLVELDSFDLMFLDLHIRGPKDGVAAFAAFKERWPAMPIVVLSGSLTSDAIHDITRIGFAMFAQKPACFTEAYFEEFFRILNVPPRPHL
jgi:DNA-binding NtrC family response regulator